MQVPLFWITVFVNILQLSFSIYFFLIWTWLFDRQTLVSVYIQRNPALRPPRLYDHLLPQLTSHSLSTQTWKSPSHFIILKTSLMLVRTLEKKVSDRFSGSHQWNGYWGCIRFWARSILEGPDNWRAPKAVVVYMQDRNFNSFASNMIKLSVNEKNEVFCWPEPALLLILLFRFEYLISGLKSYRDFGQTGPWSVV